MHTRCVGNFRLGLDCFFQDIYPVSLFSGKLRVSTHRPLSFQPERKASMLTQLAFYAEQ
uniref:Uncharacterized protein n=1 Tax=Candidatus Kentrum eta TaxID=2126337 RepID=A0A450VRM3_9GAMM|nr:MAG: hypothetical protein BECKH772B_GA0070898_107781 [Candidatus Kentron sp. H]